MFGGIRMNFDASEAQAVKTPEELRELALADFKRSATSHRNAVLAVIEGTTPTETAPQHLISAVVKAGSVLDGATVQALKHGITPGELAEVGDLHPLYVQELARMAEDSV